MWHGMAWHLTTRHGISQHDMAWHCMVWYGMARYGTAWHMTLHSLAWHGQGPPSVEPPRGRAYCNLPALLPWGHGSSSGTSSCSGSEPPKPFLHTPKTRGTPANVPLAPCLLVPCCGTPTPQTPPGTALPSPAKQVLPFIFGWRRGCKRSPAGAQPHCKPLQPHCKPLRCPLWAGCRQTTPSPRRVGATSTPEQGARLAPLTMCCPGLVASPAAPASDSPPPPSARCSAGQEGGG